MNSHKTSTCPDTSSGAGNIPNSPQPGKPVLIRDLTDDEKPREKAQKLGIDALTDVELLAILLGTGIQGKSVLDLSRDILRDNDNKLRNIARKTIQELTTKYKGMGPAKATLLVAAMNFGARCQSDMQEVDPRIASSKDVYHLMRPKLERLNYEEFWVLHLSRANRVQFFELISRGGLSQTVVDIKLIAKSAIDHLSSGLILVHNHPSGNLSPSPADKTLTQRIIEIARIIDVKVLDHIIVAPTGYYSFADEGIL